MFLAGRRHVVIREVMKPSFKKWMPLLVIINPKSGSNEGIKLLKAFRGLLNPAQVNADTEIANIECFNFVLAIVVCLL